MRATPIEPFVAVERDGFRVTPVPVSHGTDTLAMFVDDGRSCVAFAADTGPTDALWKHLASHQRRKDKDSPVNGTSARVFGLMSDS